VIVDAWNPGSILIKEILVRLGLVDGLWGDVRLRSVLDAGI